jgi:hypothetical protein
MLNSVKLIRFFSDKQYENLGQPVPTKKFIPEWYRTSEAEFVADNGETVVGLKACIPFLDAMMSGYVLTTPVDIFVSKNDDGTLRLSWNSSEILGDFINERPVALGEKMPRPAGHYPNHLAFRGIWGIKTPKKWSVLVVHPLNRHDLPFTITSGIMDTDKYSTSGNIPFFIKEGFIGVIPEGTPFAQLIPIKRASWRAINNDAGLRYLESLQGSFVRTIKAGYKKMFWQRKEYN